MPSKLIDEEAKIVEIQISQDGTVIWVNTEKGCMLRICRIEVIEVVDSRK